MNEGLVMHAKIRLRKKGGGGKIRFLQQKGVKFWWEFSLDWSNLGLSFEDGVGDM